MIGFIIFLSVVLGIILIYYYNGLIKRKNQVDNAFGSIDVMLKNRYDLIPALIDVVKGYMKHEESVLTELTELRTRFIADAPENEKVRLDGQIRDAMKQLAVSVENYPELKAGENFIRLQQVWSETEENISAARRFFNTAVTEYNNKIEQFPSNLIAYMMGLERKLVFEIPETQRQGNEIKSMFN